MIEEISKTRDSKLLAPQEYSVEETTIQVKAREFLPLKEQKNHQEALVLFLGWSFNENASSYEELAFSLADNFDRKVILVNTKTKDLIEDSLYHEAEAVHNFIHDLGIVDAILAGYSQGGAKATNLAVISQEKAVINPRALILFSPTGLNSQKPGTLAAAFSLDFVAQTIPRILTERTTTRSKGEGGRTSKLKQYLNVAEDVAAEAVSKIVKDKTKSPRRLAHEVSEMSQKNPRLEEIRIPVVLVQGKYDHPSGPKGKLAIEQMGGQDKEGSVEKELKNIFPNSPYVKRVLAKRTGKHTLLFHRSRQISKVVSYLVGRQKTKV